MTDKTSENLSVAVYSLLFIVLYGSGFIGAKLGFPYAKPLVFLVWRFMITTLLLLIISIFVKAKWPRNLKETLHITVSGLFLVCLFSIGTWVSMDMGVPPAISALIIALQPIIVAIGSFLVFRKKVRKKQWLGLVIGLAGVALVVGKQTSFSTQYLLGIVMSFLGLIGLAVGNLYQKKFCTSMNIFTGGVIQSFASGVVCYLLARQFGPMTVQWTGQFVFSLFWMCIIVSLGAISFLYILLKKGESHKVASLFYLVPIVTAIISYFAFNTTLGTVQLFGMMATAAGVALVNIDVKKIIALINSLVRRKSIPHKNISV